MAKKEVNPEPPVDDDHPLVGFAKHQRNAAVEAGRAIVSIIPRGLREHGIKAVEESAKGFGLIVDAVVDSVSDVVRTVKDEVILPKDENKDEEHNHHV